MSGKVVKTSMCKRARVVRRNRFGRYDYGWLSQHPGKDRSLDEFQKVGEEVTYELAAEAWLDIDLTRENVTTRHI